MKIGILLPTILASEKYAKNRIFTPKDLAIELANGLVNKGHEVYLYSTDDVMTKAKVISGDMNLLKKNIYTYAFRFRNKLEQTYKNDEIAKRDFELNLTNIAYQDALKNKIEIIHSFYEFSAHYFNELTNFPTVYTLHDPLPTDENTIEFLRLKKFHHHKYISISNYQKKCKIKLNFVKTIYHGINLSEFDFNNLSDNYLIYFGRMIEDKGPEIAIQLSLKTKNPLYLATSPSNDNRNLNYYEKKIKPFIDQKQIILKGYLKGKDKSDFIKSSKAFLFPIQWEEPFGLVMIEAMACGTPVVAYARGSVPEIIKDGETGFIVNSSDEDKRGDWIVKKTGIEGLCEAVERIYSMPQKQYQEMRRACRKHVENNFTVERMVDEYEKVYQRIINQHKSKSL